MRLIRRVGALEAVAEEVRLRPYKRFAADHGMTVDQVLAVIADERWLVNRLEAEGLTDDEIVARCAEAWGIPLDQLCRGCEDVARRYFA